jgi:Mg-chelatase subunit ChlD
MDANGTIGMATGGTVSVDPNTHNIVVVADSGTANQISEGVKQLNQPAADNNLGVANNGTLAWRGAFAGPASSGSDGWQASGTAGAMDGESSFDRATSANKTDQLVTSGLRQQQPRATSSPEAVAGLDLQGGVALDQSQLAGDKAPVLGDVPVLGRMYRQKLPGVSAAAAETAPETLRLLQAERAKETSQSSAGYLALNSVNSFDGTAVNAGTLPLNGDNNYINGTTFDQRLQGQNAPMTLNIENGDAINQPAGNFTFSPGTSAITASGGAFGVDSGKFYSSLTADDANGVRYKLADVNPATGLPLAPKTASDTLAFDNSGQINRSNNYDINGMPGAANIHSSTNDITLNFRNAPLDQVLNNLSDKAGFVIVQDTPVKSNVTVVGRHLTQDEAVDLLNSQLNQNGYVAIRDGRTLTIVNKNDAKTAEMQVKKKPSPAPVPQPEILTRENAFSTFSLNVSDVSFKLAAASLEKGQMPEASSIRSEEFINAFDYRDPEAAAGQPLAFASERARYPFAQNRDLLRFSVKTAAAGRPAGRALNLVLLLDTSGSMERADRVAIIREAMRVLTTQLQPQDTVSVVTFARTARLWADGVAGDKAGETLAQVGGITPEGGTNLEEAMRLAYETARRHYLANGMNRVVLLTDGAANLGNVDPGALKQKVEAQRRQGIALDCFGIGWEDFNDNLLEELSGNGDGRYAFINSPEDAANDFAAKLAGALKVAAQDVKVQVEFNPQRVISWRQIGYAKHQLTKEQFRDNTVLAAEIAAQEAGNALYTVETKPDGIGPVATVYVRYKIPGTENVQEHSWEVPYAGNAVALEQSSAAMRLAATANAFSEWLAASPFAQEVSPDELLKVLSGVPEIYGADSRPIKLATMIREARSIAGK